MVYTLINLPVVIFYIANGLIHLYYSIKLRKKFPNEQNFIKNLVIVSLWIIGGLIYPFFFISDSPNMPFFQFMSMFFIVIFTPFMIFLVLYYQHLRVKKEPELKKSRCLNNFFKEFEQKSGGITDLKTHTLKTDLHRKALHLFPASLIIFLWVFAIYIWAGWWNADAVWGVTGEDFGVFITITAGYGGIWVFGMLDYLRLSCIYDRGNYFWLIPDNVLNLLGKAIKRKEFYEFIGPTVLVISFIPVFLFARISFGIFAAATMIATIGDAFASLGGMKFGKHHFPKNSHKTIEGYIFGFVGSFGIAFIALVVFSAEATLGKLLIMAFAGATVFLIIDLLSLKVDDNILNPLFCGFTMGLIYLIL